MVNKSRIVVLLRQFWVSPGKEKVSVKRVFLLAPMYFQNFQRWECLELSCEPGSQISQRSNGEWVQDHYFSETDLVICRKMRGFWEEEKGKRKWEGEEA